MLVRLERLCRSGIRGQEIGGRNTGGNAEPDRAGRVEVTKAQRVAELVGRDSRGEGDEVFARRVRLVVSAQERIDVDGRRRSQIQVAEIQLSRQAARLRPAIDVRRLIEEQRRVLSARLRLRELKMEAGMVRGKPRLIAFRSAGVYA